MTLLDVFIVLLWLGLGIGMALSTKISHRMRIVCLILAPLVFGIGVVTYVRINSSYIKIDPPKTSRSQVNSTDS